MTNDELLHKWVNNTITQEELSIFKQRPEYDSLTRLYNNTEDLKGPTFDSEAMLSEILASPKLAIEDDAKASASSNTTNEVKEKNNRFGGWLKYAAAACVLVLAGLFLWPQQDLVNYQLAQKETLSQNLPDGSNFVLNADSKLYYSNEQWGMKRILNLEGEAYFKVENGSTFSVVTPLGKVQVLGTQFNVRAREGVFEVACTEGKVKVVYQNGKKAETLLATEALRIEEGKRLVKWEDKNADHLSWTKGITKLRDASVQEIIYELERQFNVSIESKGLDLNDRISCNFQHTDLEKAIKTTMSPLGVKYKVTNNKVVLSK